MEKREKIQAAVSEYFVKNAQNYIPNFVYLSEDDKNHIVNIGTSIICTRDGVGYPGGSFVQSIVSNDLRGSFATADHINQQCIRFYVMMMYNMAY